MHIIKYVKPKAFMTSKRSDNIYYIPINTSPFIGVKFLSRTTCFGTCVPSSGPELKTTTPPAGNSAVLTDLSNEMEQDMESSRKIFQYRIVI
jgi:hypothetical protein